MNPAAQKHFLMTVRMYFFPVRKVEKLEPLTLTTSSSTIAELNLDVTRYGYKDFCDGIDTIFDQLKKMGRPARVEVDCHTSNMEEELKAFTTDLRQLVFKYVLSLGYVRDHMRRYVAVKTATVKAIRPNEVKNGSEYEQYQVRAVATNSEASA